MHAYKGNELDIAALKSNSPFMVYWMYVRCVFLKLVADRCPLKVVCTIKTGEKAQEREREGEREREKERGMKWKLFPSERT